MSVLEELNRRVQSDPALEVAFVGWCSQVVPTPPRVHHRDLASMNQWKALMGSAGAQTALERRLPKVERNAAVAQSLSFLVAVLRMSGEIRLLAISTCLFLAIAV